MPESNVSSFNDLSLRLIEAMDVPGLEIPSAGVKFFKKGEEVPLAVLKHNPEEVTLTSCQALKQAFAEEAVCLTKSSIGCIAAAITFGLVDQNDKNPLGGSRVYTDLMHGQSIKKDRFAPPSPKDFTSGKVYACKASNNMDFCLFGENDSGRFATERIAKFAVQNMTAIQPPVMKAVFIYNNKIDDLAFRPDVVVMNVRPVELARIAQAYSFKTGNRIDSSIGPVRAVNSDLIVRPYLTGKINVSTYCVGARLIAGFEGDRMGIGIPYKLFSRIVEGMEDSRTGYPYYMYPNAEW